VKKIFLILITFVSFCFGAIYGSGPGLVNPDGPCPETYTISGLVFYKQSIDLYSSYRNYFHKTNTPSSSLYCYFFYEPKNGSFSGSEYHVIAYVGSDMDYEIYDMESYNIPYSLIPPPPNPECGEDKEWNSSNNTCVCKDEYISDGETCAPKPLEQADGREGECGVDVGSYIIPKYRTFNDDFEIKGTPLSLHYSSSRVSGYKNPLYPYNSTNIAANGWTLSNVHYFDNATKTLHLGDGEAIEYGIYDITTLTNGNTIVYDKSHIGHEFNKQGLILRSFHNKSNNNLYTFTYSNNNLIKITDILGKNIVINRDSANKITSIVSPYNQKTFLQIDNGNDLTSIAYEDSSAYIFEYGNSSLLTKKTTPRNYMYSYVYDNNGRINKSRNPIGSEYSFSSSMQSSTALSSFTAPSGASYSYTNSKTGGNGVQLSSSVNPFGDTKEVISANNELDKRINSCGISTHITYDIDDLSMQKRVSSINKTMPSGLNSYEIFHSSYTSRPSNTKKETATYTLNGKTTTTVTDYYSGTHVTTSPEKRSTDVRFDRNSLLITSVRIPSISTTTYTYNTKKELTRVAFGARVYNFTYDTRGNVLTYKDALGTYTYTYDNMDRVTSIADPNNYKIYFYYDAQGNMIRVANPTSHYNDFTYNALNDKTSWNSPLGYQTRYTYNEDGNIASIQKPSGSTITNSYISSRLQQRVTPQDTYNYFYNCGSLLSRVTSSNNEEINYSYDGELLTNISYSGLLDKDISYAYNSNFLPTSIAYAGETEQYTYDNDALITKIDSLNLTRNANVGAVTKAADSKLTRAITYNTFGEQDKVTDTINKKSVFSEDITSLNNNGQILRITEKPYDRTITHIYTYDKAGRLTKSTQQHRSITSSLPKSYDYTEEFTYDSKGNILTKKITKDKNITAINGIYSIEDGIEIFGNYTYRYNIDGYLTQKTSNTNISDITEYRYGVLGELREVIFPDKTVTYKYNALNQKTAKLINNEIVEKYLWLNLTTLLAVYDKYDNLIQRYYYYPDTRVPYKVKDNNNNIYYLSYNHQGTLKQVTDINGNIVKAITYSVYGETLNDTNPNMNIPFNFAGGIIDSDTKLIRFGYRDYDPITGKWTSKDPIDFNGGDINLYNYVLNDPVNLVDPSGLMGRKPNPLDIIDTIDKCGNFVKPNDKCTEWGNMSNNMSLPFDERGRYREMYVNACLNNSHKNKITEGAKGCAKAGSGLSTGKVYAPSRF